MPAQYMPAQPHSIWLCCEADEEDALQADIAKLTKLSGTPAFTPHVTLLGDLNTSPSDTYEVCRQVFGELEPITVRVRAVASTHRYFMSLFLDLDTEERLAKVRAQIARDLSFDAPTVFRPHISLAYGLKAQQLPDEVLTQLEETYTGQRLTLSRVVCAASSSALPIKHWKTISEHHFAGAR